MCSNKGCIIGSLLVILVALGIPILETAFAITRRALPALGLAARFGMYTSAPPRRRWSASMYANR
jgi:hypothetical protein